MEMFANNIVCVLTLLTLLAFTCNAQEIDPSDAVLVDRCEGGTGGCSGYDAMMEHTLNYGQFRDRPETVAVIRVCSKEPTPIALSIAATDVEAAADWLETIYAFTPERIRFIRSEDCQISRHGTATTELWAVVPGARMPSAVEVLKPYQYRRQIIGSGIVVKKKNYEGDKNYRQSVKKLVKLLREHREETGLVIGYYFEKPRKSLKRRMKEVELLMQSSGLAKERYTVRLLSWNRGYELPVGDSEPRFPVISSAAVVKAPLVR
jgi:hypothetical protein